MRILTGLMALFITASALAQNPATCNTATIAICSQGSPSGDVQIRPQAVPTSATAITGYDAYLKTVTVTNTTGGAITFTLTDRQASPIDAISAVSIAANTTYVITFPNFYWCAGGFKVSAGGAGLVYYAAWRQ